MAATAKGIFDRGRRNAGDGRHLVEDLLEGEVFAAEDVAAAGRAFGERGDVGARDFGDIDEIEAGVDVGGKFAVEEVDEDAAGGRGLAVVGADGGGGVEDDDLLAVLGCACNGFLLGEELGALVVADHVGERDGRVFVDDDAVGAEVHGGDAGGVDEALDAGFAGHAQQLARAVDVGAVHGGGIGNPEAVVGGDVDDGVAAGEARRAKDRVGEIADDEFRRGCLRDWRGCWICGRGGAGLAPSAAKALAT